MVGSMRWPAIALACLPLLAHPMPVVAGWAVPLLAFEAGLQPTSEQPSGARSGADASFSEPGGEDQPALGLRAKPDSAAFLTQPGDELPRPFVPLHPSTVEDRQRIEAMRLYATARAMEDRGAFGEAVDLLQQALKLDPESVAIPRRLSRIYIGALGRPEQAVDFGKKVLTVEPGDTDTLSRLVEFYNRKNDLAGCVTLLKGVLANPRLDDHAPGRLLAQFELGKLYAGRLNQVENAAKAYAEVMEGLDDRAANKLSPADQVRILGNDPASAYLSFGMVFLAAKQNDLAVRAFERGLVYDEENPQIPLLLAETLLKQDKGPQALALVERYIKRQPQSLEAYELMAKVLSALHRENEITPRLEEAARIDSKNVPLQYVLADRYRETGLVEKADALYRSLLTTQPTPQTYRALAASLLKRKKAGDLLKVICEAMARTNGLDAITAQLQAAASDDSLAEAMLDAGLQQLRAKPPALPKSAFLVLSYIANPERGTDKAGRLERLIKIQRLLLEQSPTPQIYREIADTLRRMDQVAEAAATIRQMIEKFPSEKTGRSLLVLAELERRAGHTEAALSAVNQAAELDANDVEIQLLHAELLGETGKVDRALEILRNVIKGEPENARYKFVLGGILSRFGRNEEAIKVFQELLQRFAGNDELARLVHSNLSIIYVNQGDYAKGEAELEVLFQKSPDDAGVNNDLGYLYAEQGKNLEKAEAMIRRAVHEEPHRPAYLDSLGWVLFKRGKVKEALEPLQQAVDLQKLEERKGTAPADATIREHLGDIYLQLQEVDKARQIWEEAEQVAAKAVPQDKRLPEIRKKLASLRALGSLPKSSTSRTP
ncbi:MAG: tetratricopeptide repeat protein [Isosphaeraceae bacterium]